jgi:hypothetical protein
MSRKRASAIVQRINRRYLSRAADHGIESALESTEEPPVSGSNLVRDYRLYFLDRDGHIRSAEVVRAPTTRPPSA